jgi:hypothetical protein
MQEGMSDNEYYNLFKIKGAIVLKSKKEFVAMIPRIYYSRIYKKKGFGSIFECAAKLGGVSHAVVEEVIRVEEKLADLPELKKLMPKVGLSKLRRVAGIATKETENEWVGKVQEMSKSALETHIQDIRKSMPGQSNPVTPEKSIFDNDFESFSIKLNPKIILKLRIIKQKMGDGKTWNDVFEKMIQGAEKVRKERAVKAPVRARVKITRYVPATVRRELPEQCQYPGCNKPAEVIHHPHRFALQANHENLKPLCKSHHELVHSGYSGLEPRQWQPKTHPLIEKKFASIRSG